MNCIRPRCHHCGHVDIVVKYSARYGLRGAYQCSRCRKVSEINWYTGETRTRIGRGKFTEWSA